MKPDLARDPDAPRAPKIPAIWLSALVGVLLASLVGVLWFALAQGERESLRRSVQKQAEVLAERVASDLRGRLPGVRRIANRWEVHGGLSESEFDNDARSYMADVPGFQAIEWADPDLVIRWVVPLDGNERAKGLNLAGEQRRKMALERSRQTGEPIATGAVDLVQGGRGFLVYFPVRVKGEFHGFVVAVFRISDWLEGVLSSDASNRDEFRATVLFDGEPVYSQRGRPGDVEGLTAEDGTTVMGHRVSVRVQPTEAFVDGHRSPLPEIVAVAGLLLSALVAGIVYLLQRSFIESWQVRAARSALEKEVAERERAEEKLQFALSRLDIATKAGGVGVWMWDLSTDLLTWNDQMFQLLDVPPEVVPRRDVWRAAVHPDDLPQVEDAIRRALRGQEAYPGTYRIMRRDGDVRHIGGAARTERDGSGVALRVMGVTWDITERVLAEQAARASEERLRLILNSTAEAIYGIDTKGVCTFANRSCASILGVADPEMLLGKNMHQLIHHSYADGRPMPAEDCSVYQAGRLGSFIHREDEVFWKADGTSFPCSYSSFPQVADGEVVGAVVTFTDITDRKQAEEVLRASEDRLRSITGSARDAIIMIDPNGNISFWNPAAEAILGHSPEEAMGQDLHDLIVPQRYHPAFRAGFDKFRETGRGGALNSTLDVFAIAKGGRELPVEISIAPIQIKGQWHAVGILRDVTERRESAIALQEAKEAAEAANRAKGDFLANMSHEIRTPMNGIIGYVELALRTELDERQREYLETSRSSARALLLLLNDILDFSKIEAGRLVLESVPLDPRMLATGVQQLLDAEATAKGLTLEMRVADDVPQWVSGDPGRLRQVLLNLGGNAVKFTSRGTVSVSVAIEIVDGARMLRFAVADTGVGIPADKLEMIFSPFAQADTSTTRRFGGTGLGLAISRQLVTMMGGRLHVESSPGVGSTFSFSIPLLPAEAPEAEVPLLPHPSTEGSATGQTPRALRVLAAEDNPVNQTLIARMLALNGHEVVVVPGGQEAVEAWAAEHFDVILMDVQMPGMSGLEATAEIREREAGTGSRTPIIALTARAMKGDRERCLEAGMDGYLTKPLDARTLLAEVEAAANSLPPRPPEAPPDRGEVLARFAGDRALFVGMAAVFDGEVTRLIGEMRTAAAAGDAAGLTAAAHDLKSLAGTFGGAVVASGAAQLEVAGRTGEMDGTGPLIESLSVQLEVLRAQVKRMAAEEADEDPAR